MSGGAADWLPILLTCLGYIALYPIISFCKKLHDKQTHIVVRKRYYSLVLTQNIFAILTIAIQLPLSAFGQWTIISDADARKNISFTAELIFALTFQGFVYAAGFRFYMVAFDVNTTMVSLNDKWKSCINTNHKENTEFNWFQYERSRLGNFRYLFKIIIAAWVFTACLAIVFVCLGWIQIINFCCLFFWYLAALMCYRSIVKFFDNLWIRGEMQGCLIVYSALLLFYLVILILKFTNTIGDFAFAMCNICVISISFQCLTLLSTAWVCHKIDLNPQLAALSTIAVGKQMATDDGDTDHLKLVKILRDCDGFVIFMRHLSTEFSVENLLCFTELLQYKTLFTFILDGRKLNLNTLVSDMNIIWVVSDVRNVPLSEIIAEIVQIKSLSDLAGPRGAKIASENINCQVLYAVALKLFLKYVDTGSPWEVNISYNTRKKITDRLVGAASANKVSVSPKASAKMSHSSNGNSNDSSNFEFNESMGAVLSRSKSLRSHSLHSKKKLASPRHGAGTPIPTIDELYSVFDMCLKELMSVMQDSHSRFIRTKEHEKLKKLFQKKRSGGF